jgi:hypothetical protein
MTAEWNPTDLPAGSSPPECRHCGEPLAPKGDYWTHAHGLYRCQTSLVPYGHNAAHPDMPCVPGGPNPCLCQWGGLR